MSHRVLSFTSAFFCAALAAASLTASSAAAQEAGQPPPPPPPGYAPSPQGPPPGYQYGAPPPGYGYGAPPPGYGYGVPGQPQSYPTQPLGPKTMDYEEGDPIPAGYRKKTHVRKGMVIGGGVTFGAVYLLTLITAAFGDGICSTANSGCSNTGWRELYIPIAGPFIAISGFGGGGGTGALVIDGIAQAGGLALMVAGLMADQTELVRNDVSKKAPKPHVYVAPTIARGSSGLGLIGTF